MAGAEGFFDPAATTQMVDSKGDAGVTEQVKKGVKELCDRFPIY